MGASDRRDDASRISGHLDAIRRALRDSIGESARAYPVPLTAPQILALQILVDESRVSNGGLSLSELSRRMGLAHSTASGIVMRLERHKLIRRTTRPEDRRYISIELAEPVKAWIQHDLPSARLHPIEAALARASSAERTAVVHGLALLERLLAESDASSDADKNA